MSQRAAERGTSERENGTFRTGDVLRNTRCQLDSWVWEKGEVLGSREVWGCELEGVLSKYLSFGL